MYSYLIANRRCDGHGSRRRRYLYREKEKDSAAAAAAIAAVHFAKIGSPFGPSFAVLRRGVAALSVLTAMPTPIPIAAIAIIGPVLSQNER